jgi:CHAD domain-containing protein
MSRAFPLIAIAPDGSFGENAPIMLLIRFAELIRLSSCVEDSSLVSQLHNMRIAAKRLRYTMEIYQPCFSGEWAKEFKEVYAIVKSVQEQLGDIHDCDVRAPAITKFLNDHSARRPEISIGLKMLANKEKSRRDELFEKFATYWRALEIKNFQAKFYLIAISLSPISAQIESLATPE